MSQQLLETLTLARGLAHAIADADIKSQGIEIGGQVFTADSLIDQFERAINSLRQQQPVFDDLEVFRRINAAVAQHGSISAAAREFACRSKFCTLS